MMPVQQGFGRPACCFRVPDKDNASMCKPKPEVSLPGSLAVFDHISPRPQASPRSSTSLPPRQRLPGRIQRVGLRRILRRFGGEPSHGMLGDARKGEWVVAKSEAKRSIFS